MKAAASVWKVGSSPEAESGGSPLKHKQQHNSNAGTRRFLTIPNLLSLVRIALIPIIIWLICRKQAYEWALGILLLSGATDIIDGWIARRYHMVSDCGKILDPVADKLTQAATLLCLIGRYRRLLLLFVVLAVKECILAGIGLAAVCRSHCVRSADWYGKLTTVLIYFTMALHIIWPSVPITVTNVLVVLCLLFMSLSFILYLLRFLRLLRETRQNKGCGGDE